MRDPGRWLEEYIAFWLDRKGNSLTYSMWYASSLEDYLRLNPDPAFEAECLDKLVSLWEDREKMNLHPSGLFWSQDGYDAMV